VNTGTGELWASTVNTGVGVYNLSGGTMTVGNWTAVGRGATAGR